MGVKNSNVVIIGAGIIGCATAIELAKRGAQVTVVDKGEVGHGCSYGNAGWMTPCFAMPLPMPGMMFKSIKWLLNPEGPLYIKPSLSPALFFWLSRFLLAMNEKQARAAVEVLVELSKVSLQKYQELALEFPEIDFNKKGLLMVAQSKQGVAAAEEELRLVSEFGIPGKSLNSQAIKIMEPALTGNLEGGVYFPEEAHGEPLKIVQALAKKARSLGVKIIENSAVTDFIVDHSRLGGIEVLGHGKMSADQFVLATGSWSPELAKKLSLRVPILGGKGYALIVDPLAVNPKQPLMLIEKKIAVTPRNGTLRIAGTLELVNQDFTITERRVRAIIKGAKEFLTLPDGELKVHETWAGLRPCTPDGIPLIGYSEKIPNLMFACGHQMLGLQTGAGTGLFVADLMDGRQSFIEPHLFRPDRF